MDNGHASFFGHMANVTLAVSGQWPGIPNDITFIGGTHLSPPFVILNESMSRLANAFLTSGLCQWVVSVVQSEVVNSKWSAFGQLLQLLRLQPYSPEAIHLRAIVHQTPDV
jgi:hypothetical protein